MEDGQKLTKKKLCSIAHSHIMVLLLMLTSFTSGILLYKYLETSRNSWINPPPLPPPEYQSPGPYFVEYPHKYNFIINEEKQCQEVKPFLVLIVPTTPQNKEDRQIIRDSWGGQKVVSGRNVALFFLLGLGKVDENELLEESKQYRDILQGDFIESYKNLTIKTMLMLEWLDSHCRGAAYAMKIDTDMFLNLPKLMEVLENQPRADYLTGIVVRGSVVQRDVSSKWFVPFEFFMGKLFPPYVLGQGYILSLDLPSKLSEVANREKKAFYIEDVYLGMCLQRLGLEPTDPPYWGAFSSLGPQYDRCTYSNIIATIYPKQKEKLLLWKTFSEPGPYC